MTLRSEAAGAGRAFPIDSENFAIQSFKQINPSVEWDPTNFLVDYSGNYANCNYLNQKGEIPADRSTPEGFPITVMIDSVAGSASDVDSVNGYLRGLIQRWMSNRQYHNPIRAAKRVGCSVRPGCSGNAVVACLFSDGLGSGVRPTPPPPRPPTRQFTMARLEQRTTKVWDDDPKDHWGSKGKPNALAFTPEQYKLAEEMINQKWDRAHFLENLSGFETSCDMIGKNDWPFSHVKKIAGDHNVKVIGQYGSAINRGSTPDALREILSKFKKVSNANQIGCSVIPDCQRGSTMMVVVGCLFEEN